MFHTPTAMHESVSIQVLIRSNTKAARQLHRKKYRTKKNSIARGMVESGNMLSHPALVMNGHSVRVLYKLWSMHVRVGIQVE